MTPPSSISAGTASSSSSSPSCPSRFPPHPTSILGITSEDTDSSLPPNPVPYLAIRRSILLEEERLAKALGTTAAAARRRSSIFAMATKNSSSNTIDTSRASWPTAFPLPPGGSPDREESAIVGNQRERRASASTASSGIMGEDDMDVPGVGKQWEASSGPREKRKNKINVVTKNTIELSQMGGGVGSPDTAESIPRGLSRQGGNPFHPFANGGGLKSTWGSKGGGGGAGGKQITTVAHVDFADAMHEQKPKPWTRTMFKLYFFLFVACLNSCINGYDGSIMAGINATEDYQSYFNISEIGAKTGLIFSMYTIGNIIGSFFSGPFTDNWGRRWGMFIGSAIILLGTAIQAPSTSTSQFLLGRFVLGFGVATCATSGPSYVVEMAHPAWRGTLTGLYNTFWFLGAIPAAWCVYGARNIPNNFSWRLPIALQAFASGIVLIASLFCPETPRWLMSNDRHEEAISVLANYHGEGNRYAPIVLLQYREMMEEISTEGSDKLWWDYRVLVNSRSAWWRLGCVAGIAFFGQWSGNGVVSYFLPALLDIIGVSDEATQLQYNGILNVIQFAFAMLGARFSDRLGRRPVLIWGTAILGFWWMAITVMTGIYAREMVQCGKEGVVLSEFAKAICEQRSGKGWKTPAWSAVIIALIYLFGITYSFTWTPLQALYPVECLEYEGRAKGMGVYNLLVNIAMFFNTFAIPTILEKISWRVFFIYIGWNALAVVVMWAFFVETKGRTLEEINEIFEAQNPRNRSLRKHVVVLTGDGLFNKQVSQEELI